MTSLGFRKLLRRLRKEGLTVNRGTDPKRHANHGWPERAGLSEVDLLALMDPRNIEVRDTAGNRLEVRSAGPSFEMSMTPEGWQGRMIYEDRVVDCEWDEEAGQWREP